MNISDSVQREGVAAWLPAGLLSLAVLAMLAIRTEPSPGGPVALIYPPWWPAERAVLAAASVGALLRLGAWPGVVVVRPMPGGGDGGAWLRLDPIRSGLCGDGR